MKIRNIIYLAMRKWWIIVLFAILGGGIGFYQSIYSVQTLYSSDATLYALNKDKLQSGQTLSTQDLSVSQAVVRQYSGIFYSRSVTEAAAVKLEEYNVSASMLSSMVQITSQEDSTVLKVSAVAPDPELAAAAANAMAEEFIIQIRAITNSDFIGVLDRALPQEYPIQSNGIKKMILFLFGGVVIALGIIYLLLYFDTRVHSVEDIEDSLQLRVIGIIPEHDIR